MAGQFRGRSLARLACVMLALVAGACDKVPLLAPTSSTISVSAGALTLPLGGSTEISAFVSESSGTPVQNGTTVTFSTTMGTLSQTSAQTKNGIATVTFKAGDLSGVAEIRANSGGIGIGGSSSTPPVTTPPGTTTPTTPTTSAGTTASSAVQITIGAAAARTVSVTANPAVVPVGGGTVAVTASVLDGAGNRLVGVPVTFSANAGTLSSTVATTDASGNATVMLTTSAATTVTAVSGGATAATATIALGVPPSVTLTTAPDPLVAGLPMTLTVTPGAGTAPRVSIDWGDGTTSDLGVVAAARGVTHVYKSPGGFSITATATANGETFTTSAAANITAGAGVSVSVGSSSASVGEIVTFMVTPAVGTIARNVAITFGDGDFSELGAITATTEVRHPYSSAGSKTVTVTETDVNGVVSRAVTVVVVTQ